MSAGLEKFSKSKEEVDFLDASMGQLAQVGAIDAETANKYLNSSLGAKRAIVTQGSAMLSQTLRERENFTPSAEQLDAMAGAGYVWGQQSNRGGSYMPVRPPTQDVPSEPTPQFDAQGNNLGHILNVGGKAKFVPLKAAPANPFMDLPPDPSRTERLQRDVQDLQGKVTAGNKRWGPDWLPFMPSYEDQLARKQQELAGMPGVAGSQGPTVAQVGGFASPEAVRGAVRSGQLHRAQAEEILRTQFGYQ
ncbi:MAG: hypothetical protein L0170_18685 [Acidobacteria bacterium]|nr:hypothetical protein [Acidobacteriota bacterium]